MFRARSFGLLLVTGLVCQPTFASASKEAGGCRTLYDSFDYNDDRSMRIAHGDDSWGMQLVGFKSQSHPHKHTSGLDTHTLDHAWGFFNLAGHDYCL